MLEFDTRVARLLEIAYQGAELTRRRQASFDALHPGPGETILDVGCGNGLLTAELARAVGPSGHVIGVDPSSEMRKSAADRCGDFDWVKIVDGSDSQLPVAPLSIDKAVSVQVFEYLTDLTGAVAALHRALRPGGRLVVGDLHLDSLIWFSRAPERMTRMLAAWDNHFTERTVPAVLPPILRNAGFIVDDIKPTTICDFQLKPDGLARMMMILMEHYAVSQGLVSRQEAADWAEEQQQLAAAGHFFFSISHFVVCARKAV